MQIYQKEFKFFAEFDTERRKDTISWLFLQGVCRGHRLFAGPAGNGWRVHRVDSCALDFLSQTIRWFLLLVPGCLLRWSWRVCRA